MRSRPAQLISAALILIGIAAIAYAGLSSSLEAQVAIFYPARLGDAQVPFIGLFGILAVTLGLFLAFQHERGRVRPPGGRGSHRRKVAGESPQRGHDRLTPRS